MIDSLSRRAGELDPSYAHSIRQLSVLIYQDRFEEARAEADALVVRRPGYSHYLYWRGIVEMYAGDPVAAGEWIRRGFERDPDDQIAQGVLAEWEARHGDRARARALLATAELGAVADGTFTYWIAKIYAALGQPSVAVEWLERAEALGYWNAPWLAKDPTLAVLHGDPGFEARLRSVREKHEAFAARVRSDPEATKLLASL